MKIKFFCRSFNKQLYLLSRRLYEDAGYTCVRLTDQTADGYFLRMLEDRDCDIAINVDEDCFIANLDIVLDLAQKAYEEGLVNIGCSDAALGCPRGGNAMVTNPFFNIFNLKLIREIWNLNDYKSLEYSQLKDSLTKEFLEKGPKLETIRKDLKFEAQSCEPYYKFFFWLLKTFPRKTLYLDSERHFDGVTTKLFYGNDMFCCHTWFARQFNPGLMTRLFEGNDKKGVNHKARILNVINEVYAERDKDLPYFSRKDKFGFWFDGVVRWCVKVPQRIMNWPHKLKQKLQR